MQNYDFRIHSEDEHLKHAVNFCIHYSAFCMLHS